MHTAFEYVVDTGLVRIRIMKHTTPARGFGESDILNGPWYRTIPRQKSLSSAASTGRVPLLLLLPTKTDTVEMTP